MMSRKKKIVEILDLTDNKVRLFFPNLRIKISTTIKTFKNWLINEEIQIHQKSKDIIKKYLMKKMHN